MDKGQSVESFFNNTDTGNIKFYKERGEGNKWRWVLFDLDWAMSPSTYQWNMVEEIVNPSGHGVGRNFDTSLMVGLMKNRTFRETFISTYGKYLRTTFATDRLLALYDQMVAELDEEMPYHMERWAKAGSTTAPRGYEAWKGSCATPVSYTHLDVYKRQASVQRDGQEVERKNPR